MVEDYPYNEEVLEDLEDEQLEDQVEKQQEVYEDMSPTTTDKDDLFSLFWKVVLKGDSSKVGNLDPKTELGNLTITVRDLQRISLLGNTLGHKGFARFFFAQGEIMLATSASKKGWLPELFVSQRKFTTKEKQTKSVPMELPKKKKKWGLFGNKR